MSSSTHQVIKSPSQQSCRVAELHSALGELGVFFELPMNASRLLLVASLTSCASALMAFRVLSSRSLGIKVAQQRIRGGAVPMMSTAAPVAASTTVTNPLLDSSRTPQFRSISAADVVPAVSSVLANLEADVAKLEETLEAKVRNFSVRRNKIGPKSLRRSDLFF